MDITKPLILEEIVKGGKFLKICENISKDRSLSGDLFQECILILLEKSDAEIVRLYQKNELKAYFIRIVQNNYNSKTSPFFKKYRSRPIFKAEDNYKETESSYDYEKIISHIKSNTHSRSEWFDSQIVNVLLIDSNITKLSKKTGIHKSHIYASINRFKERINGSEEFKRKSV